MPVFNLQLKFDEKGAVTGVIRLEEVAAAAAKAGDATRAAGKEMSNSIWDATKKLGALIGAYKSLEKAMGFLKRGIDLNSSLEQSRIGIATLITSMANLEDAQGKALVGAEKYAAAQGMAADMMSEIQKLGLETTATSKELVEGVQSIMGPALQAGMALKDIPKFAVAGAQAMQTLGIPLNQMRTELEALLSGSVNKAQDILAPKLFADINGDLNEYLKNLKASGTLLSEIEKRLEPFRQAGADVGQTWIGIVNNLEEAADTVAGIVTQDMLQKLKEAAGLIQNLMISDKGKVGISEDFENIAALLTEIANALGGVILDAVKQVTEYVKSFNNFLGDRGVIEFLDDLTVALKLATAAFVGFAGSKLVISSLASIRGALAQVVEQVNNYKIRLIEIRKAQVQAALAEQAKYEAFMMSAQGERLAMSSQRARNTMLAQQIRLTDAVTAAQQRLNQAQNIGSGRAGLGAMGAGFAKLLNLMGGPLNVALMGAISGLTLVSMNQSEAEKAAEAHARALETLNTLTKQAADSNKDLADWLGNVAEARRNMAIEDATNAMRGFINEIKLLDLHSADYNDKTGFAERAKELDAMAEQVSAGKMEFSSFYEELSKTYNELYKVGETSSMLGKRIKEAMEFARQGADSEQIIKRLTEAFDEAKNKAADLGKATKQTTDETVKSIKEMADAIDKVNSSEKSNVNTLEGAIKWLEKRNAQTEEGKAKSEALAKATDLMALATLNAAIATAEFNAAAANTALLGDNITQAMIQTANQANDIVVKLNAAKDSFVKGMKDANWGKVGGGGRPKGRKPGDSDAKKAENAAKKWQELNDQLSQLEGKSTGATTSLNKTLKEIEDTGKAAKKSAEEIETLKKAFVEATDAKTIKELNKELLQLEGNTRAVEAIENKEKTDQFRAKLNDIRSLSDDEKNILLGRYEQAIQTQINVKDMQTALDFMKDLESLGGEYGETLQLQNQLIEYQAGLYRDTMPAALQPYITEWERLKKLENDKSFMGGLERGVRKFGEQYGDLAANVESFTTQMGSTISNTLSNAFMTGKFSAQDFFSSLVGMAAQAASNQFIGMIFQGLFGAATNAFGSYNGLTSTAAQGAANTSGYSVNMGARWSGMSAKGNVFEGAGLSAYSNSIVSSPTFFGYERQYSAYAKGAGLMGEAGPEGILPLARMSNGDLGVQYKMDYDRYTPQVDSANYARIISDLQAQIRDKRQYNGGMPQVNINIENNSNAEVQTGEMRPDGNGGYSMDIIISQIEQGMVGRAKQGKSQLQKYQQAAYGFNRAGVIARGRGRN